MIEATAQDRALPRAIERELSDWRFVTATILVVLALTSLPYLFAYATTPPDRQFMGILLDVPDHVQYFSWMRELSHAPLAANKLTPEPNKAVFFNLLWWGLGHLGAWLRLDDAAVFQVLRVTAASLFLLLVYRMCAWFLPDRRMRRTAFLIATFTSGFGWALVLIKYALSRGDVPSPNDLFIAEGNTFLGILAYPHFIEAALYIFAFDLILRGERRGQLRYAVAAGLVALFMGWQHAYDLWSVYGVLAAYGALQTLRDRRLPRYLVRAGLITGFISCWPALYSVALTSLDPVWKKVLSQFTNAGVFTPNLLHLPILMGPALLLALLTALQPNPLRLRGVSNNDLFLRGWFFITFLLIYLPVEYQVHLLNGWQVPIAILATLGLYDTVGPWVQRLGRRLGRPLTRTALERGLLVGALLVVLPTNIYLWAWRFVDLGRHTYPYYLSKDDVAALNWLDAHAHGDDVVLSALTLGQYVPEATGAHAFLAHWAQTLDYYGKSKMVGEFYSPTTDPARRDQILDQYRVDYVLDGPAEQALGSFQPARSPRLTAVYSLPSVTIYAVK